jgi:hypothetical protein
MSIDVRYSDDGGHNNSNWRELDTGDTGDFIRALVTRRLGMTRHRIWEFRDASGTCADILAVSLMAEGE